MKKRRLPAPAFSQLRPGRSVQAEAERLLADLTTRGFLGFLGGQALLLDSGGRLLSSSKEALGSLGLEAPFPPEARFPSPEELNLAARGFSCATLPVLLGAEQAQLCVFRQAQERQAEPVPHPLVLSWGPSEAAEARGARSFRDERDTLLVVDDSPVVLHLLQFILARGKYVVVLTDSGEKALTLAQTQQPDLILLDVLMPGLDGFEVCRRLKADSRTCDIPVLFVTSLHSEADEVAALDAGAIDFIPKPIVPATLLARVRNHLELKHSKDRLRTLSLLDGLTGIANRRQFDQGLEVEWQRAAREGRPLSLVMGDVDFFKQYNDHFGHAQGDECLRRVAQVFKATLRRPGDMAARIGGEEFICILPDTDEAGAFSVAEELLAGINALALAHPQSTIAGTVTLSLGVATAVALPLVDPRSLVLEADQNLYEAKRLGRNRISQGRWRASGKGYL